MARSEVSGMSGKNLWWSVAVVGTMAAVAPLVAHHAFSAEFDATKPVKLTGPVTKVELVNPHAWIHIQVTNQDGSKANWEIEGGTPNTLQRRGITRDTIKIGTIIVVDGFQSKDGTLKANGRNLTFPDGRTLFMGSSGTGAPRDGRDPTEK
jgi:Family of unknown function (DUF6152)